MLAQQLKVDQSTDTADLQPIQAVFHSRIKEEETHVVEVSPVSVKRARRTRRSKKQAQSPMEYGKTKLLAAVVLNIFVLSSLNENEHCSSELK